MSGANQQNPLAMTPAQQAEATAKREQEEKRAKEDAQYERIAEGARAAFDISKSDWRYVGGGSPEDRIVVGAQIRTPDTTTGLIRPGRYRRSANANHPANEFDVLVHQNANGSVSVSPCYRKSIQVGINTVYMPLSDSDWKKAQGEVLDMMYAGRGRSTVTLDWPHSHDVTEKYVMLYLDEAYKRGMNVTFGGEVEKFMAGLDQKAADRIYQRRQAIEDNYNAKQGVIGVVGNEIHDMKQDIKRLKDPAQCPTLNNPALRPDEAELDEDKKARYKSRLTAEMGIDPAAAPPKTEQEKRDILQRELNSVKDRLTKSEDARARLDKQIKDIMDIRNNANLARPEGQKAFELAERRLAACNNERGELLRLLKAEEKDIGLRLDILKPMLNPGNIPDAQLQQSINKLQQEKAALEKGKNELEAKKPQLEKEKETLSSLLATRTAENVARPDPTKQAEISNINARLTAINTELANHPDQVKQAEKALSAKTAEIESFKSNTDVTVVSKQLNELRDGKPVGLGDNDVKRGLQQLERLINENALQASVDAARNRMQQPQQAPQNRAP